MSRKQQIWFVDTGFPAKSALAGGDAGNQAKGGQMNQGHRRFLVASALAAPAHAEGGRHMRAIPVSGDSAGADSNMRCPGIEQRESIKGRAMDLAAGNVGRIMAAATLLRQVLALEGLASPNFLPALL